MKKLLFFLSACCVIVAGRANNIVVGNVTVSGQNAAAHTTEIHLNVSWDNSWRTSTNESNYDGAWLFAKYRTSNAQDWRHCTIRTTGFTAADGATIVVPDDRKGVFIYRSADGIGNVDFTGNKLVWDYGADGVADNASVEIKVFGLEMVYVPTGAYWLGGGGTEAGGFRIGNAFEPYKVTSADEIPVNNGTGLNFNGAGGGISVPAAFPNAFNAFWIMKYECSQQQYADFLNTLELAQANILNVAPNNFVTGSTHPNFVPVAADRAFACYNKPFNALTAMADWAGLRPMSEMEFEKTCRGAEIFPVPNAQVWGTTAISHLTAVSAAGTANESVGELPSPQDANALMADNLGGRAARVGIFARATGSTRVLSGGAYYGVMNMGDNVFEIAVNAGSSTGQVISRNVHGDGYLSPLLTGQSDIAEWRELLAFMRRGTSFQSGQNLAGSEAYARLSNRGNFVATVVMDGIRLARTAP